MKKIAELRTEQRGGRATENDDDFRSPGGECLTGAQVERDSGPAPVVDLDLEGGVGLGGGAGGNAVGLPIALILGPDGAGE